MIVAITGGTGFIGRNLYKKLSKDPDITIRILDLRHPNFKMREQDTFIQGDILDKKNCVELLKGADILFHNASENSDINIPNFLYFEINEKGTKNLLEACSKTGVKKFIYKSTTYVYGKKVADDNTTPKPNTFYGKSKLAAEKALAEWSQNEGNKSLTLRTPVIIGPGNRANIYNFIRVIYQGRKPFYLSSDKKTRSITSLTEFIDIVAHSIKKDLDFIEKGNFTCNVVSYPQLTIKEMHDIICEELGIKKPTYTIPLCVAVLAGYLAEYIALITRKSTSINGERVRNLGKHMKYEALNKHKIGYTTQSSAEECIRATVRWYRSEKGEVGTLDGKR
jgi:UDP-glucose 4-epimerase